MQSSAARPQGGDRKWCIRHRRPSSRPWQHRDSWAIPFADSIRRLIVTTLAVVKISGEISRYAGFDLAGMCLCGRGRLAHGFDFTLAGEAPATIPAVGIQSPGRDSYDNI